MHQADVIVSIGHMRLNLLVFVLIFFVTIRVLYSNPVRTLIAVTVFMYLSGMCAELFVYYGKELLPWEIDWNGDLLYTILSKIVWLLIIKLASILVKMHSGTNVYVSGKYALDGVYDPNLVDKQIGVYVLLTAIVK